MNKDYLIRLIAELDKSQINKDIDSLEKDLKKRKVIITPTISNSSKAEIDNYINQLKSKLSTVRVNITFPNLKSSITQLKRTSKELQKIRSTLKLAQNITSNQQKVSVDNSALSNLRTQTSALKRETENAENASKSFFNSAKENINKAFTFLSGSDISSTISKKIQESIKELYEMDKILTEISKSSNRTKESLKKLGDTSFETASKYGQKANDYLLGVQEMSRAGFGEGSDEKMAELAAIAQSAGNISAELANQYLIATNAAFGFKGSINELNDVLDGQTYVTTHNAVSMEGLAEATKVAASQLAESNISANEVTALLGTGIAATQESGDVIGKAVKGIVMNLQQVEGEIQMGDIIDAKQLEKTEARCHSVGVELRYVKDGAVALRNPIEVLRELADVYNSLPDDSVEKAGIISDIGGNYRGNVLSSILSNWELYEKMLADYSNGNGAAMDTAAKSADSWEGSLNKLSNTWTDIIQNLADSDGIIDAINALNGLMNTVNNITSFLGSAGTLGLGIGAFLGIKNLGKLKVSFSYCFKFALHT